MRITLLAANNYDTDPRAHALRDQLVNAGHTVSVVRVGPDSSDPHSVPSQLPSGSGLWARVIRRLQSASRQQQRRVDALVRATGSSNPDLIHPTTEAAGSIAVTAAHQAGCFVARAPQWKVDSSVDWTLMAPSQPSRSGDSTFHTVADSRGPTSPAEGRHSGTRIALAYRKTDINPGKYLEAALTRAGVTVDLHTDSIDFDQLHPQTSGVVFVEGPYPALTVSGATPDIPVAFWVHHGEHHLAANLRLARVYRADLILLAHSWHLAHFFAQPVQRFPFGMAPDLLDASKPIHERTFDVAMVGAYIRGGGPYEFRGKLTTSLEAALSSVAFEQDVPSERMAELYEDARIIPNEGGTRHFPITMRVLEAIGAGAVLVSQFIPGLDQILTPGEHYVLMDDSFVPQFQALLEDHAAMQKTVDAATAHVHAHHLYDHRVDELLEGLTSTTKFTAPRFAEPSDELAALIAVDVEVQRILVAAGTEIDLPDRETWTNPNPPPTSYEAVVFSGDAPSDAVLLAARRYIYGRTKDRDRVARFVEAHHPDADVLWEQNLVRIDLKADSYRVPSPTA